MPPIKRTCSQQEIRFSQWLESIRKDVECTFGILKGRFRILKTGIRLNGQQAADRVFLTCCALHNWLLEVDGLDDKWEEGMKSRWERTLGYHDLQDVEEHLPEAITRLMSPAEMRAYDVSGMGYGPRRGDEDGVINVPNYNPMHLTRHEQRQCERHERMRVRVVKDLSLSYFRHKLIQHFDIAFQRNEIVWPGRRNILFSSI